jgi:hypothetical protein
MKNKKYQFIFKKSILFLVLFLSFLSIYSAQDCGIITSFGLYAKYSECVSLKPFPISVSIKVTLKRDYTWKGTKNVIVFLCGLERI